MTDQKGIVKLFPLLIAVAILGVLSFLLVSSTATFQNQFGNIFPKQPSFAAYTPSNFEIQLFNLINTQRQNNGLQSVQMIAELADASIGHNNTMQSCALQFGVDPCLSHQVTQLNEPAFGQRIKNAGYNYSLAGEIIGRGYATPADMVNGWMNSPDHRAIILDGRYLDMGCGFLNGGDTSHFWWSCDFGKFLNGSRTIVNLSNPSPNDLYVSSTGVDTNSCIQSAPCKTIQRAANIVTAGQTVHVAPGNYINSGTNPVVTSNTSGTSTARIVFQSDTKWGAKLVSNSAYRVWMNTANYVDIVNFDISSQDQNVAHLGIQNEGSNVRTIGNHVHNIAHDIDASACDGNGGAGIVDGNTSGVDNDQIGNLVHDIGNPTNPRGCWTIHGLYHSNLRGHVLNNISYNNEGFGIHLWHAANATIVANNLSFHNNVGGMQIGVGDSPGNIAEDNYVISNNIIMDNGLFGVRAAFDNGSTLGPNNKIINNNVFRNGASFTQVPASWISGTLSIDPQFVNYQTGGFAAGGDYHLKSSSPMVNAGTSQGAPTTDYDGVIRPQGSGFDIGPFEFLASSPTPIPSPTKTPSPVPTPTRTPSPAPSASPACPKGPQGDANCDGAIDIFDYSAVITHFNQSGTNIAGDVNKDGIVDIFDYSLVVTHFGQ